MEPPSSRTICNPAASLPSERPRVSVSTVTGTMTKQNTTQLRTVARMAASSKSLAAEATRMISRTRSTTCERTSRIRPKARAANDAGRSSRTTASPVTIELKPAPCFDPAGPQCPHTPSLAAHLPAWTQPGAHKRRLSGAEADELLRLYQTVSAHLSLIRSVAPETALSSSLSAALAQARTRFTGARSNFMEDLARFFVIALPTAFYRIRWLTMWCAVFFLLVGGAYALWIGTSPEALRAVYGSDESIRQSRTTSSTITRKTPQRPLPERCGPTMLGSRRKPWPSVSPGSGCP